MTRSKTLKLDQPRREVGRPRRRRVVWDVTWETSGMGGSDSHHIKEWDGRYVVPEYYLPRSSHKTLRQAVRAGELNRLPDRGVRMEITCPILTAAEMAQLLEPDPAYDEYGAAVILNGEVWVYDKPGIMRPAETQEEMYRVAVDL